MDVEKTIEFLLQAAAQAEARAEARAAEHDARMKAHHAQFMAEMSEMREHQRKSDEEFRRRDEILDRRLTRAVRMSAEEHRRERVRRKELAGKVDITTTAVADLARTVDRFIESMKQGRNGHDKA
jgi:hypothetical protein